MQENFTAIQSLLSRYCRQLEDKGYVVTNHYLRFERVNGCISSSFSYKIPGSDDAKAVYVSNYDGDAGEFLADLEQKFKSVISLREAQKVELSLLLRKAAELGSSIGLGESFVAALTAEAEALASNAITHQPEPEVLF